MLHNQVIHCADNQVPGAGFNVLSPFTGTVLPLSAHSDPIFANGIAGSGVCIDISGYKLLAPFNAQLTRICEGFCQYYFKAKNGLTVMIAFDIPSQYWPLKGIKMFVSEKEQVTQGQTICTFDFRDLPQPIIAAVVIVNADKLGRFYASRTKIEAGTERLLKLTAKKKTS